MGLYNFNPRFVAPILRGTKRHTIRAPRKYPDEPGNMLHLYVGLRQKGARLLMRRRCVAVQEIEITLSGITLDGVELSTDECDALARIDGFPNGFAEMLTFWTGRLPFAGQIIHWKRNKAGRFTIG